MGKPLTRVPEWVNTMLAERAPRLEQGGSGPPQPGEALGPESVLSRALESKIPGLVRIGDSSHPCFSRLFKPDVLKLTSPLAACLRGSPRRGRFLDFPFNNLA
jgi:hypothetical protein